MAVVSAVVEAIVAGGMSEGNAIERALMVTAIGSAAMAGALWVAIRRLVPRAPLA